MSAFRQSLQVFADVQLSPDANRARFADATIAARDDLISTGQASARYATFIDGAAGGSEQAARRTIAYQFNYVAAAAGFALGYLRARSPVLTGNFRDSFFVAVNGRPIRWDAFNPDQVPGDAEVIIYNSQPYARKVDVQFTGRVALRFSVPAGMFDETASTTQRRYAGVIKARRLGNVNRPGQMTRKKGGAVIATPALVIDPVL